MREAYRMALTPNAAAVWRAGAFLKVKAGAGAARRAGSQKSAPVLVVTRRRPVSKSAVAVGVVLIRVAKIHRLCFLRAQAFLKAENSSWQIFRNSCFGKWIKNGGGINGYFQFS